MLTIEINTVANLQIDAIKEKCAIIKPIVVIRCITYNQERYINDALDGFINQQTIFPFVAIIHDDHSTDKTAEIVKEYAEKYPNIILPIFEQENQYSKGNNILGLIMNKACKATGAKYVATCEGDDYWTDPFKLQKQFDALEANPECSIALNRVNRVNINRDRIGKPIPRLEFKKEGIITLKDLLEEEWYNGNWTFQTSSFFYKNSLLDKICENRNTIFKRFPYGDMPMLLTCLLEGNGFFIPEVMGCYTVLSGGYNSEILKDNNLAIKNYIKVVDALEDFNEYTNHIYDKELQRGIARYKFNLEWMKKRRWNFRLFLPQYKPFYKIAILKFIESIAPRLYNKIKLIRNNQAQN